MNDQERQIISDIFRRLESSAGQSRDQDAERFIADKVKTQPYAPYAMAQSLYVQEEAMKSLNEQLDAARRENEQLRSQGSASGGGGFLSSIFGGGQRQQPAPGAFSRPGQQPGYGGPQPGYGGPGSQGGPWGGGAPQQGGPWGGGGGGFAQQAAPAAGGGGFLRGALTTAAGVAGGMVVGNALMNAFSGGHSALGNLSSANVSSLGGDPSSFFGGAETQNASFSDANFGSVASFGGPDASLQDASFDDGGGFDGGDDSSWT